MPKAKNKLSGLLSGILSGGLFLCKLTIKVFFLLLPTIILISLIETGHIELPGPYPVVRQAHPDNIHEIFPNTRWEHLKPCGTLFDEEQEFSKALSCVNEKVWPDSPLPDDREVLAIPRCFIVSVESPDIFGMRDFNFVPVRSIFGTGAVVGVYQPETKTVFMVENVDAAMVYRHELQHFFLHLHDPATGGGGHYQEIWKKCEPPFYSPTEKAKLIGVLMNDELINAPYKDK